MKILSLNAGSSSLKFKLFQMKDMSVLAEGMAQRIGFDKGAVEYRIGHKGKNNTNEMKVPDHKSALLFFLGVLTMREDPALSSLQEIEAVGHRVVHGGERFTASTLVDADVMEAIDACSHMAPLHNPANLEGIRASMEALPDIPHVAVFDTAFHQTMPASSFIFPLPYEIYSEMGIRRYGFHGTSHKYVAERAAALMNKPVQDVDIITCHLGNGSSVTAIKRGQSVATSLGFGTLGGVMMGTRPGDLDPAVLIELLENRSMSVGKVKKMLYKESGLLGISGVSSDIRDIEKSALDGNPRAKLSLELLADSIRRFIGSYAVSIGGADAIVFTGGIGENSSRIREMVCQGLEVIGADLDRERNNRAGHEAFISSEKSRVLLLVVPTDEERMIAVETFRILSGV